MPQSNVPPSTRSILMAADRQFCVADRIAAAFSAMLAKPWRLSRQLNVHAQDQTQPDKVDNDCTMMSRWYHI